ncbi:hypothetical protein PHMEG_00029419, partial [Phytophthora megakarya]
MEKKQARVEVKMGSFDHTSRTSLRLTTQSLNLMKSYQNAKQAQLASFTADNWASMLSKAKSTDLAYLFYICTYMQQRKSGKESDVRHLLEFMKLQIQSNRTSPSGKTYILPDNTTFRQMQHLDAMRTQTEDGAQSQSFVGTRTIRLNGSRDRQLTFNTQELWDIMELTY